MGICLRKFSEKVEGPFSEFSLRQNHHFCHDFQSGSHSKSGRMAKIGPPRGTPIWCPRGHKWSDTDHPICKIGWSGSGRNGIREDPISGKFVPIWYKFPGKTKKQMGLRNLPSWEISGSLNLGWEDRGVNPDGFPSDPPVPSSSCPKDKLNVGQGVDQKKVDHARAQTPPDTPDPKLDPGRRRDPVTHPGQTRSVSVRGAPASRVWEGRLCAILARAT